MMPGLKDEELTKLAGDYDFSGGQIENIARKCSIVKILSGKDVSFDQIYGFCGEETLHCRKRTRIGF